MACGDKVGGHDGGDWVIQLVVELDVSRSDDSDELRAKVSVLYKILLARILCINEMHIVVE